MKKLFLFFVSAVMMLGMSSCKSNENFDDLKDILSFPQPSMNFGISKDELKKEMTDLGYTILNDDNGMISFIYNMSQPVFCQLDKPNGVYASVEYMVKGNSAKDLSAWLEKNYSLVRTLPGANETSNLYQNKKKTTFVYSMSETGLGYFVWGSMTYGKEYYDLLIYGFDHPEEE